jgi:hypothetical protein
VKRCQWLRQLEPYSAAAIAKVVRREIGVTHRQAMHPHNPTFIHALVESVAQIRAVARSKTPAERTAATAG